MHPRRTVLVVAAPEPRTALVQQVQQSRLSALEFDTLEDALPAIAEEKPLLAVVQLHREPEEAFHTWEALHTYAQLEGMPVVACGAADFRTVRQAFAAGAEDLLPWPVPPGALQRRLERLLTLGERPAKPGSATERSARKSRTVLLASDDVLIRMRLEALLQDAGYTTLCLSQGTELVAALRAGPRPSACLVDTALPELEGLEGVLRIRHQPDWEGLPVVAILSQGREQALMDGLRQLGVRDFLETSDVGLEGVVPLVDEVIAAQSARRGSPRTTLLSPGAFRHTGGEWEFGFVYNLSERGIFVRTLLPPAQGVSVSFRFELPPGEALLEGRAKVAWVQPFGGGQASAHPPGMGLLFEKLPEAGQQRVQEALRGSVKR